MCFRQGGRAGNDRNGNLRAHLLGELQGRTNKKPAAIPRSRGLQLRSSCAVQARRPGLGEGDESFSASDKQTRLYVQVR